LKLYAIVNFIYWIDFYLVSMGPKFINQAKVNISSTLGD